MMFEDFDITEEELLEATAVLEDSDPNRNSSGEISVQINIQNVIEPCTGKLNRNFNPNSFSAINSASRNNEIYNHGIYSKKLEENLDVVLDSGATTSKTNKFSFKRAGSNSLNSSDEYPVIIACTPLNKLNSAGGLITTSTASNMNSYRAATLPAFKNDVNKGTFHSRISNYTEMIKSSADGSRISSGSFNSMIRTTFADIENSLDSSIGTAASSPALRNIPHSVLSGNVGEMSPLNTSSTSSATKRKRKFPGPAGILPELKEGEIGRLPDSTIRDETIKAVPSVSGSLNTSRSFVGMSTDLLSGSQQCSQSATLCSDLWSRMEEDLEPQVKQILPSCTIRAILAKAGNGGGLMSHKVPVVVVVIQSITIHSAEASVLLKDSTGTILGTVHRDVLKDHTEHLQSGSVLILKQVGVLSPLRRNLYLNITPSNLVRLYVRSTEDVNNMAVIRISEFTKDDLIIKKLTSETSAGIGNVNYTGTNRAAYSGNGTTNRTSLWMGNSAPGKSTPVTNNRFSTSRNATAVTNNRFSYNSPDNASVQRPSAACLQRFRSPLQTVTSPAVTLSNVARCQTISNRMTSTPVVSRSMARNANQTSSSSYLQNSSPMSSVTSVPQFRSPLVASVNSNAGLRNVNQSPVSFCSTVTNNFFSYGQKQNNLQRLSSGNLDRKVSAAVSDPFSEFELDFGDDFDDFGNDASTIESNTGLGAPHFGLKRQGLEGALHGGLPKATEMLPVINNTSVINKGTSCFPSGAATLVSSNSSNSSTVNATTCIKSSNISNNFLTNTSNVSFGLLKSPATVPLSFEALNGSSVKPATALTTASVNPASIRSVNPGKPSFKPPPSVSRLQRLIGEMSNDGVIRPNEKIVNSNDQNIVSSDNSRRRANNSMAPCNSNRDKCNSSSLCNKSTEITNPAIGSFKVTSAESRMPLKGKSTEALSGTLKGSFQFKKLKPYSSTPTVVPETPLHESMVMKTAGNEKKRTDNNMQLGCSEFDYLLDGDISNELFSNDF